MPIHVTRTPDVYLTPSQLRRYQDAYRKAFMMHAGTPPDFEEWVAEQEKAKRERGTPQSAVQGR